LRVGERLLLPFLREISCLTTLLRPPASGAEESETEQCVVNLPLATRI